MTLALRGIEKRFDGFELGPLDLVVDDVTAVLGPSGCGKTTLLSIVAGLRAADAGEVRLDGRRLDGLAPEDRRTAMVFQDGALFPHMTARENVAYAATSPQRVAELATRLEITDVLDRPATALSGGQTQRVALARALAADPDALLLDEPLANLDAPIRRRLRGVVRDWLADLDGPVIYVTHDQRGAAAIGDRVAVMGDGTLHQIGTPRSVFERPATAFVAAFTGATNQFRATVAESSDQLVLEWEGRRLVTGAEVDDGVDEVTWFVRPEYVRLAPGDGENVFDARIERVTYEGDAVVVTLRVDERRLESRVEPAVFDRLDVAPGADVRVGVPSDAVHVVATPRDAPTRRGST